MKKYQFIALFFLNPFLSLSQSNQNTDRKDPYLLMQTQTQNGIRFRYYAEFLFPRHLGKSWKQEFPKDEYLKTNFYKYSIQGGEFSYSDTIPLINNLDFSDASFVIEQLLISNYFSSFKQNKYGVYSVPIQIDLLSDYTLGTKLEYIVTFKITREAIIIIGYNTAMTLTVPGAFLGMNSGFYNEQLGFKVEASNVNYNESFAKHHVAALLAIEESRTSIKSLLLAQMLMISKAKKDLGL